MQCCPQEHSSLLWLWQSPLWWSLPLHSLLPTATVGQPHRSPSWARNRLRRWNVSKIQPSSRAPSRYVYIGLHVCNISSMPFSRFGLFLCLTSLFFSVSSSPGPHGSEGADSRTGRETIRRIPRRPRWFCSRGCRRTASRKG